MNELVEYIVVYQCLAKISVNFCWFYYTQTHGRTAEWENSSESVNWDS